MNEVAIKRDHEGKMHLYVGGAPVRAINVHTIGITDTGLPVAYAHVALDKVTFGEVDPDNVVVGRFPGVQTRLAH